MKIILRVVIMGASLALITAGLMAQNGNDEILIPEKEILEKTARMYQPGVRRTMGLLEWPAMRRLADRLDPSYKN